MSVIWEDVESAKNIEKWRNEKVMFLKCGPKTIYITRKLLCSMLNNLEEDRESNTLRAEMERFFEVCPRCMSPEEHCSGHC